MSKKKNSNKRASDKNKKVEKRKKKTSNRQSNAAKTRNNKLYSSHSEIYMGDFNATIFDEYHKEVRDWWDDHYPGMPMPLLVDEDKEIPPEFAQFKREAYGRAIEKMDKDSLDINIYPSYHSVNGLKTALELQAVLVQNAKEWSTCYPNLKPRRKALDVIRSDDLVDGYAYIRGVVSNVKYNRNDEGIEYVSEIMLLFPEILITNDINQSYSWNIIGDHIWVDLSKFLDAANMIDMFLLEDKFEEDEIISFDIHLGDTITVLAEKSKYEDVGGNNRSGIDEFYICQRPKLCYKSIIDREVRYISKGLERKLPCRLMSYTMSLRVYDYHNFKYLYSHGRRSIGEIVDSIKKLDDMEERIMKTPYSKVAGYEDHSEVVIEAWDNLKSSVANWELENNNQNTDKVLEDLRKFLGEQRLTYYEKKINVLNDYQHLINRAIYKKNHMDYIEGVI